jgi:hypothetical protein
VEIIDGIDFGSFDGEFGFHHFNSTKVL